MFKENYMPIEYNIVINRITSYVFIKWKFQYFKKKRWIKVKFVNTITEKQKYNWMKMLKYQIFFIYFFS